MKITLDHTSDRSLYLQLADVIRFAVTSGELKAGESIPSARSIGTEHGLALGTVREAVNLLKNEGLLETRPGKGVYVRSRPSIRRLASDRFSRRNRELGKAAYLVDVEQSGRIANVDSIKIQPEVKPNDVIASRLNLSDGDFVAVRSRRYMADGEPVELAVSYIPCSIANQNGGRILDVDPGPGGIYARIEEQGLRLESFTEEITARLPSHDEARQLAMNSREPVFEIVRVAHAEGGRPVEECDTIVRADRYTLYYAFPAT